MSRIIDSLKHIDLAMMPFHSIYHCDSGFLDSIEDLRLLFIIWKDQTTPYVSE